MCLAIPGELLELQHDRGLRFGKVRFGGITRRVCLEYVPEARVGDYVLVHVGFALSTVDREEAERTLRFVEALGEANTLLDDEELAEHLAPQSGSAPPGPRRPGEEGDA